MHGPQAAVDLLYYWQEKGMVDRSVDDHQLAHRIGRETARVYGINAESFLLCPMEAFNGGCQHGFFEYVLGRARTAIDAATTICETLAHSDYSPKTRFYCYHGVGHGVMMASAYKLHEALDICDALPNYVAQDGCWQGVFMENVNGVMFEGTGEGVFFENDPLAPCNALADKYRHECYVNHAGWLMRVFGNSVYKATRACLDAGNYISSCLQSIGLMVTNPSWQASLGGNVRDKSFEEVAWDLCLEFPVSHRSECVIGGVDNILNFDVLDTARAKKFCTIVDASYQVSCFERIGTNTRNNATNNSIIKSVCATLGNEYAPFCLRGAGLL